MAKTTGPLFSFEAHGSIAKELTFSRRNSRNITRYQKKQKDVITTARTTQRGYFEEAYAAWNTLSSGEQKQWNDFID